MQTTNSAGPDCFVCAFYYDGYKTPSVDAPLGDFFGVAVPALVERLKTDPGPNYVFDSAIYALGNIGRDAKEAISALEEISRRPRLNAPAREAILQIQGNPVPMYH